MTAQSVRTVPASDAGPEAADRPRRDRLSGLDGIRGLAALFVVLHHCYLVSFGGYPKITGPGWAGWLIYGHFAVVVFIVLSGFSLAVSPARHDWQLGGKARFAFRRAWRILPPYWAALAFSLLIAWTIVPQPGEGEPTAKSVAVFGLLLQDVVGSPSPNGAFWSIAVEAQLYLVLPILLVIIRKAGTATMLAAVAVPVLLVGIFAPSVSLVAKLTRFTPQFAILFAAGVAAAGVIAASDRVRRMPWHWFAGVAALPVIGMIVVKGSEWTVEHFFWVDVSFGPATAMLLAAVAVRRPRPLVRFLDTPPVRGLGSFSYSLYLIHAPIVVAVADQVVDPHIAPGVPSFLVTLAVAAPLSVLSAWIFASVFEIPFQRHRGWQELKAAYSGRDRLRP
ncbi:MAG: acyltransferase [Hamadaea sp.]|uniref:acyltransferase family protein n=1 Tax=Hamadaea sp. TaxID=2024425 RepID=UPI0017C07635|nr:acyltransferase [Hamadaea sp.]NUR70163.1 acyltransferase [Hamadaea sp.]NUT23523.1 acyltransferase [Hamadaea sp.]